MKAKVTAIALNPLSTPALLMVCLVLGTLSALRYFHQGLGGSVVLIWLATIVGAGAAVFWADRNSSAPALIDRSDWPVALLLLLSVAPLYLALIPAIPYQISTDEVVVMLVEGEASGQPTWDIFSLSDYFSFPSFVFVVYGWVGRLLGGINLQNMRSIDAIVGLASLGLFYILARRLLSKRMAVAAAVLLGTNHALMAISRMAMRNNSALLVELGGILFLLNGLKHRRTSWTYLGGAITGLAFYIYEPARLLLIIWLAWLLLMAIGNRTRETTKLYLRHGLIGLAGFALVVAPLVAGSMRATENPEAFAYQREQLLFFRESQLQQQEWVGAATLVEAVQTNIIQGLTAYNSGLHDNGYLYYNPGHGFVDPLTGILLWVGVLWTVSRLREKKPEDYLMLVGFVVPWLTFSFITNKAPSYTRMLITLPFVAYLTLRGIELVSSWSDRMVSERWPRIGRLLSGRLFAGGLVAVIALWNIGSYADYVVTGLVERESVGATSRYIQTRISDESHGFYIVADQQHQFFEGGETWHWEQLVRFFAGEDPQVEVISPQTKELDLGDGPFTAFMTREVWELNAACLTSRYPQRQVHELTVDGWYLAIEVIPTDAPPSLPLEICR
jgi:4-amino-4-deoxy-L-arabinose transferase-like glycosyltransferase